MRGTLSREVGQSVRLLLYSAATMAVYVALGLLAVRVLG
jgi:hypothetical protein